MENGRIKIGVLGAGHLGKIHLRLLKEIPEFAVAGFYDRDENISQSVSSELGIHAYADMDSLIEAVDAVDIVTPTSAHFHCAEKALRKTRHVFIEKPLANTLEEARKLMELAQEAGVKVQVGHVERFNPAFLAVKNYPLNPLFIEAHRLAAFDPRGTDVSVVLDLMIHDIDIVLSVVKGNIKRIHANGVAVVSHQPDIANVRIEFDNGSVANLTSSRISLKKMRKMRFFQKDAYISVDFLNKKAEVFKLTVEKPLDIDALEIQTGIDGMMKYVQYEAPEIPQVNALKLELESFAGAIKADTLPPVSIVEGYNAMAVAHQIMRKIQKNIFA